MTAIKSESEKQNEPNKDHLVQLFYEFIGFVTDTI